LTTDHTKVTRSKKTTFAAKLAGRSSDRKRANVRPLIAMIATRSNREN
jgi:hypothetical protein